jgi:hypothetical protein
MSNKKTNFKYGKPMDAKKVASRKKRLPQYDGLLILMLYQAMTPELFYLL